jgi:hypothetical protein
VGAGVLEELALGGEVVVVRVRVGVVGVGVGLLGEGGELDLLHEVADLLDLLVELGRLLLRLLLQRGDLVVGLVAVLVGVVGLLDDVRHLLALLVQLGLQLLVEVVEDDALLPQGVDEQLEVLVDRDGLVELLVGLVEPVLQDLDLLLQVGLALGARVDAQAVLLLLDDLLLEVADVHVDVLLRLLLLLDGVGDLGQELLHAVEVLAELGVAGAVVVDLGLSGGRGTISSLSASFSFFSLSMPIFCFLMKLIVYSANNFLSVSRLRNFFCCSNSFSCLRRSYSWSISYSPSIFYLINKI